MRFPSKVTPYKDSILAKFPIILSLLKENETEPIELYKKVKSKFEDVGEFLEALDCLYALNIIDLIEERNVLRYVDRSHV
ncbi:MAG: ABC-three component system middle component 7 [Oscillospiraceae bacterium]